MSKTATDLRDGGKPEKKKETRLGIITIDRASLEIAVKKLTESSSGICRLNDFTYFLDYNGERVTVYARKDRGLVSKIVLPDDINNKLVELYRITHS